MPQEEKQLLSRKEVMKLLNCSHASLSKYIKERRIPFYRVGKKYLFDKQQILNAIQVEVCHE